MKYIFLHGMGQTAESWQKTISAARTGAETMCPELMELAGREKITYQRLFCAAEKYCAAVEGKVALCGLSLGGVLALHYTAEHPEKVKSLVLIAAQYQMPKLLLHFQNYLFCLMPEKAFVQSGFTKKEMIGFTRSMLKLDFRKDLEKISCPVLVVCGERDAANRRAAFGLQKKIPTARLCLIPGAGHEVNRDAPEQLGRVLKQFWSNPV